jgi:hypothetical protein
MIWGNWFRLFGRKKEPYVSPFWSGALGPRQRQGEELRYVKSVECFGDLSEDLFQVMIDNESDVIVYGAKGEGKTRLVHNALRRVPRDFTVVVPDTTSRYAGYVDYHAPYPINVVELNSESLPAVLEETYAVAGMPGVITPTMAQNLDTLVSWLLGLQPPHGLDVSKYPRTLSGLISLAEASVSEGVFQGSLVESVMALVRRLKFVRHWMVDHETHPIIRRLLNGELRGKSVGIDLSILKRGIRMWFYTIALLNAVLDSNLTNVIIVIDEAHLFLRSQLSVLNDLMRIGRNYNIYFVLISQAPQHFPPDVWSEDKIFIEFPIPFISFMDVLRRRPTYKYAIGEEDEPGIRTKAELEEHWRDIHTAMAIIKPTTPKMKECLGAGMAMMPVKVDVNIPPKPNAVTLRRCVESVAPSMAGDLMNVIRDHGFSHVGYNKLLEGVWRCIGA